MKTFMAAPLPPSIIMSLALNTMHLRRAMDLRLIMHLRRIMHRRHTIRVWPPVRRAIAAAVVAAATMGGSIRAKKLGLIGRPIVIAGKEMIAGFDRELQAALK